MDDSDFFSLGLNDFFWSSTQHEPLYPPTPKFWNGWALNGNKDQWPTMLSQPTPEMFFETLRVFSLSAQRHKFAKVSNL
jgi:hypothetical protein